MTDEQIQANADRAHQDMVNMLDAFNALQDKLTAYDEHSQALSEANIAALDRQTAILQSLVTTLADKTENVTEATLLKIVELTTGKA